MNEGFARIGVSGEKGVSLMERLPAVYIERNDLFIITDIHLGYEQVMAETGVYLPRLQLKRSLLILEKIASLKPNSRLVINGDIKHCFHKLTRQERIEIVKLIRKAVDLGFREIIVVRGNHDNYAKAVLSPLGIEMIDEYFDVGNGIIISHGHKKVDTDFELLIMGHEHPAIQVSVGGGRTKFPVYLEVPLDNGSTVLVLPPAGIYQVGNVVSPRRETYLSPIIKDHGLTEKGLPIVLDEDEGLMPLIRLSSLEEIMMS